MRRGSMRTRVAVALAAVGAVVVGGGVAMAAIPADDGVITGCYNGTTGALRVVDAEQGCRTGEQEIAWNEQGPPGIAGPAGPAGPQGAPGPAGPGVESFDDLDGLPCRQGTERAGVIRVVYGAGDVATTRCQSGDQVALTVSTAGTGQGRIISDPLGIDCGSDCEEQYNAGTPITLAARPSGVDRFVEWTGDCSGTGTTCTVDMDAARSVTAVFEDHQPLTIGLTLGRTFTEFPGGPPEPARLLWNGETVCENAAVGTRTCHLAVPTGRQIALVADLPREARGIDTRDCDEPPGTVDPKAVPNTCYLTLTEPRTVAFRVI